MLKELLGHRGKRNQKYKQEDLHGGGVTDSDSGDSVGLSRQRAQEQGDISLRTACILTYVCNRAWCT